MRTLKFRPEGAIGPVYFEFGGVCGKQKTPSVSIVITRRHPLVGKLRRYPVGLLTTRQIGYLISFLVSAEKRMSKPTKRRRTP